MNVRDIVIEHLKKNGYDGLYLSANYGDGCGCSLDDLFPCNELPGNCEPGYRVMWDNCPARRDEGCYYGYEKDECTGCTFKAKPTPAPLPGQLEMEVSV